MALNSQIITQWRYTIETIRPCFCSVLHTPSKLCIMYNLAAMYLCNIFLIYIKNKRLLNRLNVLTIKAPEYFVRTHRGRGVCRALLERVVSITSKVNNLFCKQKKEIICHQEDQQQIQSPTLLL